MVLPDERPHREQAVMAEALIEQGRALSWTQFIAQMTNENHPIEFLTVLSNKSDLLVHQSSRAAQNFIDSVVAYESVKLWFQDWLLPRLEISVEI